jgi:hypothetical protein
MAALGATEEFCLCLVACPRLACPEVCFLVVAFWALEVEYREKICVFIVDDAYLRLGLYRF